MTYSTTSCHFDRLMDPWNGANPQLTELHNKSFLYIGKQEASIAGGFKNQQPLDFLMWGRCILRSGIVNIK
jgi:hypothetical protein